MSCQQRGRETRDTALINNNSAPSKLIQWIRRFASASMSERWGNVFVSLNNGFLKGLCVVIRRVFSDSRRAESIRIKWTEPKTFNYRVRRRKAFFHLLVKTGRNTHHSFLSKQRRSGEVRARYYQKLARCLTHGRHLFVCSFVRLSVL